jgi:hypothetical protein
MKRIKIAAIGAMLLLGLACSKDNNQYEPNDLTVNRHAGALKDAGTVQIPLGPGMTDDDGVRNDYDVPDPVTPTPPVLTPDPATNDPGNPPVVVSAGNTVEDPATSTNRIRMDVRNDQDVNPDTDPR